MDASAPSSSIDLAAAGKGGMYVPPHLRASSVPQDKNDPVYQRFSWEAGRKSIVGNVNKVNSANLALILPELFSANLVRGRGLLCRAIMKAQMTSPGFTHVYAALIAVVNTKLPEIGELLVKRVVAQFRRAYKRNNKVVAVGLAKFIAHLVNQQVAHEVLALQLLSLLLERPTDDSVEVAVAFIKECGQMLTEITPAGTNAVFERFRHILHEGDIEKRVQYMIEGLFAVRKNKFADFPAVLPELDLVEAEDAITHELGLDDEIDTEDLLDVFKFDPEFLEHEAAWEEIRKEMLGDGEDDGGGAGAGAGGDGGGGGGGSGAGSVGEYDEAEGAQIVDEADAQAADGGGGAYDGGGGGGGGADVDRNAQQEIVDLSETDLVNLRRTIYLTIMSSLDFEECAHKLMKLSIPKGAEVELANMLIECCSQEKTFLRYYGLLGQRFCMIGQVYQEKFEEAFATQYATIHRLETNKLRNVAKFFSHLLYTDALPWTVFEYIRLNEDETTSSSRIFVKILCQELAEYMGLAKLRDRLLDPYMTDVFAGMFPRDSLRNTRFAINFFTSIGLGALTDDLREFLKQKTAEQQAGAEVY